METKTCRKCLTEQPISNFTTSDKARGYRKARCNRCEAERVRAYYANSPEARERIKRRSVAWAKANPKRKRVHVWRTGLKTKFGMTEDDFYRMVEEQGGACALCGASDHGRNGKSGRHDGSRTWRSEAWNVDHDHKTGRVRGLLCQKCNVRIGAYEGLRDEVGLDRIREYLQEDKRNE